MTEYYDFRVDAFLRAVEVVFRVVLEALRVVVALLVVLVEAAVAFFVPVARFVAPVFLAAGLDFAVVVVALAGFALLRVARRVAAPFCCGFSSPSALRCGTMTSW
jgi:hypothetical protein